MYLSHCRASKIFDFYKTSSDYLNAVCANKQINKMLSKDDIILTKVHRVEMGCGAKNNNWIPKEQLVNCFH